MLPCQLLKPDKLSIFSIASQKAANSPATKLLISRVSFASFSYMQFRKLADVAPLLPSATLETKKKKKKTVANLQVSWKSCLLYKRAWNTETCCNNTG